MQFFSRRLKKTSPGSPTLPEAHESSPLPSPSPIPTPTVRLRVALDPIPSQSEDLFYVHVNPDSDISDIRRAVCEKIGDTAMSVFKVSIPWQAHYQAQAYTERYNTSVNLVSTFPSFCLDDPEQLSASLGPAGWGMEARQDLTIRDWFPEAVNAESDTISVLVRTAQGSSSNVVPITLLAHFASFNHKHSPRDSPRLEATSVPVPIDISPEATINELKAALIRADGRAETRLDKVVLWRVEMSKEEMVVIDQRGGLKAGQMPWPYPPTAPVPIALQDSSLPISHYFPNAHSNCRMVNISVWVHPSQPTKTVAPESIGAPVYHYPMVVSRHLGENDRHRLSICASPPLAQSSFSPSVSDSRPTVPMAKKSSRGRPSTAPAVIESPDSPKVHTFGSRSTFPRPQSDHTRAVSPLVPRALGLGIELKTETTDVPSLTTSANVSDDDFAPHFSNLSLRSKRELILTPDAEKTMDWGIAPDEQSDLKKTASLRVTIGTDKRRGLFRR